MLIRPAPLPDEIDRGYLGRIRQFNGAATEEDLIALMLEWSGNSGKSLRDVSRLHLLSMAAGMPGSQFALRHTTLPLRRAITSYHPDVVHGSDADGEMDWWTTGIRLARSGAYFCSACALADLEFHGQSYWRRDHQLPGLLWCPKHGTPLRYMDDERAFMSSPSVFFETAHRIDAQWANAAMANETIRRYLDIAGGLMERDRPLALKTILGALRTRANRHGFQTYGGKVTAPLLSDAVIARFGRPWLANVFPSLANKAEGILLNQIDGVLYLTKSASTVVAYLLACAVLFDSADEALLALISAQPPTGGQKGRNDVDPERLTKAYVGARGSHSEAAAALEMPLHAVARRLKRLGLPNLVETRARDPVEALSAFLVNGCSLEESAARSGLSPKSLESLVRTACANFASTLGAMQKPSGDRAMGIHRLPSQEGHATVGRKSVKYSHRLTKEQRGNHDAMADQNVAQ